MFEKITDVSVRCAFQEIADALGVFVIAVGAVALILVAIWIYCSVLS